MTTSLQVHALAALVDCERLFFLAEERFRQEFSTFDPGQPSIQLV